MLSDPYKLEDGFYIAYTGCRTTRERNARGNGINVYVVTRQSGEWNLIQSLDGLVNPSFLTIDEKRSVLYSVHGDSSEISSYRINPHSGQITPLNTVQTGGKNPVHLAIDPTGKFMVVPNHISSNIAVIAINADGSLGKMTDLHTLDAKPGPHRVEQPFPKPHQTEFDPTGRLIAVPDKGADLIWSFHLSTEGKLIPAPVSSTPTREGAGPRHIAFHKTQPLAYVVNELDSTVTAYHYDEMSGRFSPFQVITTLPETFTGNNRASEIAISYEGNFVYASNRGSETLCIYSINPESGMLREVNNIDSLGRTPRFFTEDPTGKYLYVANEDSDNIVTFSISGGQARPTGQVTHTGSPVCIMFFGA
ncbi:beta-propeller fold lactonase family protein [Acetobacter thailandicus]|nr:beta-propeller fold lactonase family protein [Acetobacter thailandicus]